MFQFLRHSGKLPFLHDQRFTLQWDIPRCKWILIHYVNSQRKPWYKRTERPYRFRRWFFRGAKGTFSNLANIHEPRITVYVFRYFICLPRKVLIPLRVGRMDISENSLHTMVPEVIAPSNKLDIQPCNPPDLKLSPAMSPLNMYAERADLHIQLSISNLQNECTWPVSQWIAQGVIHQDNLHLLQHPENLPFHA